MVLFLDAANPKSYPGSGTTWYDLSGNGNDGSINGPIYDNTSFIFDGASDYVSCGSDESLDVSGSITLSAWVNGSSFASNGHILGKSTYGNGYMLHYDAAFESLPYGGIQTTNVNNTQWEWANSTLQTNSWYNISYTYDGLVEKAYINGRLIGTKSFVGTISANASNIFYIGNTGSDCWNGKISIAYVYTKALSEDEIKQNFNAMRGRFGV